ncbi:50S ribosomal protein L20 [candidate division WOR-3 bacterium JGI_Cruoil_03_44_89]|uniref:Large ribosomal subunit protein bL20 n=1 Tax=candidate division WOR-3 bacterium JGI_Cruoil_03_44_89 TaxID=1973748 RepID=A0A235BZC7_UNCW3|nr:MAG: 50S ribosomal protein L20 [candidate division WOR-3 bacterium JGI_Cruoil_03_44_89]
MARVRGGPKTRKRRKKWLKLAKGFWGARSKLYRTARISVMKSLSYAYRDRRAKKREMRKLFISRINAASRQYDMSYSQFMNGLKKAGIKIDRKILSELSTKDSVLFKTLVDASKDAIQSS